ncbi:MAG: hypothetical protein FOGNACKC_02875 [Anaerolineae bacterium]|nr:hypothetical protein [Anaerolineae bacterium]
MLSGRNKRVNRIHPVLRLPRSALANGIRISGGSGSGKSVLAAWIVFNYLQRHIASVILDPHGGTIDFFLANVWKWCQSGQLSRADQQRLWQRIVYVDMSGKYGRVNTFPLYYRLGHESLHEISQRFLSTIVRLDPSLKTASIEGFNALDSILTPAGILMSALDLQVTDIANLLHSDNAGQWQARFEQAVNRDAEARSAVDFFKQEYFQWKREVRQRKIGSAIVKLNPFRYSPTMRAIYGANQPSIDWADVIDNNKIVCLDFRGVLNAEERRFGLLWCLFYSFVEYIKHRGRGRQHKSVGLVIDELSEFGQLEAEANSTIFSQDLNYLINILKRQYRILLTIVHQEAYQLDPLTRKTLLSMGTQILGVSHDQESALEMARQFFPYRPTTKRAEPVYSSVDGEPTVIHERPVEYSLEESRALAAQAFTQLGRFKFLAKLSSGEGETVGRLVPLTIEPLIGAWVSDTTIADIRRLLAERDGRPIAEVLAEIEARQRASKQGRQSPSQSGTVEDNPDELPNINEERADDDFYY